MVSRIHQEDTEEETNCVKNLPRRISARNTRGQETAKKNNSNNYQASRIHQEESQQELIGVKNLPRRITARTTSHQESTKKNNSKNYQASRIRWEETQQEENGVKTPAEKKPSPGEKVVSKISGILHE